MFSYMTHNHSTLLGLGLENDGKQMISNCLQGKLDRLWMIRGGSTLGLGRIVSGDAGRIDSGADRPVSIPLPDHSTSSVYYLPGVNTENYDHQCTLHYITLRIGYFNFHFHGIRNS